MTRSLSSTAAAVLLNIALIAPAGAQVAYEFGYKDRVFDQNYVLPDELRQSQITAIGNAVSLVGLVNQALADAPSNPTVKKILNGQCGELLVLNAPLPSGAMTDAQRAIEQFPNVTVARSEADDLVKVPCGLQVRAFYAAFVDAASQEYQLRRLADHIRRTFADDWFTSAQIADPAIQGGVQRLAGLLARADRLTRKGMALPEDIRTPLKEGTFKARIQSLADDAAYGALDAKLTALEQRAGQELVRLQADRKAQQEGAERDALRKRLIAEAERAVTAAKNALDIDRADLQRSLMRAQMDLSYGSGTVDYFRSVVQHGEKNLQAAITERDRLLEHLAALDRTEGGSVKADDFGVAPALASTPAPASNVCIAGQRCRIAERTVFCSSFEDMKALLGRPVGPERRQILATLKARGACVLMEQGTIVTARGPSQAVTPAGEGPVGVVAVTTTVGQRGYVLTSALAADQTASR
ncbi:hypothetical protein ABLE91_28020 [Aquabacter sp. CN5-332]|uniref:hypothetical protein n=1 Tax=Aquabacter sp. CN5-332 TaxID=3156608 RepID=UPI0032B33F5A